MQTLTQKKTFLLYIGLIGIALNLITYLDRYFSLNYDLLIGSLLCFSIQIAVMVLRKLVVERVKEPENQNYYSIILVYLSTLLDLIMIFVILFLGKKLGVLIGFLLAFFSNIFFIVLIVTLFKSKEQ